MVQIHGNRKIFFQSGQNYQDLRAETLDGCVIDEYRQQHPDLWPQVIRPMLARRKGWCDFLSTANGFDHFFELFEFAKAHPDEWSTFHAPSSEAWWWTPEEIESAKGSMTEPVFDQEINSNFRDITSGKAYKSHSTDNQWATTIFPTSDPQQQVSDKYPVYVLADFNLNPMSWVLAQCDGYRWYCFDEISLPNSHTPEAAGLLQTKLLEIKAKNLLRYQPQIIVCGDATGKAGQRAAAGKSDYDILFAHLKDAELSYRDETPESNPLIVDRVNTMNSFLKASSGEIRLHYNPIKCKKLKEDFEKVVWKAQGVLNPGKDKMLTHMSDALGYGLCKITPLVKKFEVGTLKVLIR
jgi:hypothetical protein